MNTSQIKERLIQNQDLLIEVLEKYGFCNIKQTKQDELRCSYDQDSNPTSVCINTENLFCTVWSKNIKGDIYNLLQWQGNQSFNDVHFYLNSLFDDEEIKEIKPKKQLFGGFFKQFINQNTEKEQVYDESVLNNYTKIPCIRFIEDNISCSVQKTFNIMYDYQNHYIIIPWRNEENQLVGVRGRNNDDNNKDAPKYLTMHSFKKSDYLYGLNNTMPYILQKRSVIIYESEKSVMKSWQYGYKNCCAVGSHCLSEQQIRHLKYNVDNICIAYDKDVDEETLIEECKKIKKMLPKANVYYMLDKNNLLGEKDAPVDKNIDVFQKMLKTIKRYEEE